MHQPTTTVRHGYTLDQIDRLARAVVRNNRTWWPAGDRDDQYAAAWHGIVEHLYTATTAPTHTALMEAGRRAADTDVRDTLRHHGARRDPTSTGQRYALYWQWAGRAAPSPESGVVERLALAQILPALTARQQQALQALAVAGTYQDAARLMGVTPAGLRSILAAGRGEFRRLWHEGESPSRHWGSDRRVQAPGDVVGGRSLGRRLRRRTQARTAA